jgi:nucleotidyltransferase/DNA polymerase involved in DNA repair
MIVFLRLHQFYAGDRPNCVVVRNRHVLDASDTALGLGVEIGMPIAVAKTLLAKIRLGTQIIPWKEEDYSLDWLDACIPFTDVIEPVDQHEAFLDLTAHPDPFTILQSLRAHLPEKTLYGVAHTKWLAKVALQLGDPENLAYFAPNAFLDELPTSLIEPIMPESRNRLEFLGYRTAGYVSDIPLQVLKTQFGKEALAIWQSARGGAGSPIFARYPEASIADRFYFESPVDTREPVAHAIEMLAERLSAKLQAKDLQGSILRLWIGQEDGCEISFEREFSKPMQSAASIRFGCSRLLNIEKPVTSVRLQLPRLIRANRQQQQLYVARTDSQNAARGAIGQVQKVFGSDAIKLGSDIKLPRRQLVLRAWKDATGWT